MPRKKTISRAERGKVHIEVRGRMLSLRWTYEGKPYRRSLRKPDSPKNRQKAQAIAADIEHDIAMEQIDPRLGKFDPTLEKYWPTSTTKPESLSTKEIWAKFMEFRRDSGTSGQALSSKYKPILGNLKRFNKDIATSDDARQFIDLLATRQAPLTLNQNISLLKGFGEWCKEQKYWTINLFKGNKMVKGGKARNPKRQPLKAVEVQEFLSVIRTDHYYSHYHDFCAAMFYLGLRPSEAVGLKWKDVDFQHDIVHVKSSLSRNEDGRTAGYARQEKQTKNGEERELPMSVPIRKILEDRLKPTDKSDDLIFTSPRGNPIDDHSFSQRCWKKICERIGVQKVPYAARHSLGSHLLESGASPAQVADILGNQVETTIRYYLHGVEKPVMPTYETSAPFTS